MFELADHLSQNGFIHLYSSIYWFDSHHFRGLCLIVRWFEMKIQTMFLNKPHSASMSLNATFRILIPDSLLSIIKQSML